MNIINLSLLRPSRQRAAILEMRPRAQAVVSLMLVVVLRTGSTTRRLRLARPYLHPNQYEKMVSGVSNGLSER